MSLIAPRSKHPFHGHVRGICVPSLQESGLPGERMGRRKGRRRSCGAGRLARRTVLHAHASVKHGTHKLGTHKLCTQTHHTHKRRPDTSHPQTAPRHITSTNGTQTHHIHKRHPDTSHPQTAPRHITSTNGTQTHRTHKHGNHRISVVLPHSAPRERRPPWTSGLWLMLCKIRFGNVANVTHITLQLTNHR